MSTEQRCSEDGTDSWENLRQDVLARDGYECRFCGMTDTQHSEVNGAGLDVHHIIPREDGGKDEVDNLVALCKSCHNTMETLHGKAMTELQSDSEVVESVVGVLERLEAEERNNWARLRQGHFCPQFSRGKGEGDGALIARVEEMSARELACFRAGRVEAMRGVGEQLAAILDNDDLDVAVRGSPFYRGEHD